MGNPKSKIPNPNGAPKGGAGGNSFGFWDLGFGIYGRDSR